MDDFGFEDLAGVGVSAVNPDLFLAERLTRNSYGYAIDLFCRTQARPRRAPEQIHASIARQHPLLFAAHAELFGVEPMAASHERPAVLFRGPRCIRCEAVVVGDEDFDAGVCAECWSTGSTLA